MAFATPAAGSSKPTRSDANVPLKSTCLFCSHPVRVTNQATDSEAAVEWNRLIKTLCYHMQLESKEVPKNCTTTAFPLCTLCKHYAIKLLESQNKIDEAHKIISKTITTIERTVADAEILNVSGQTGSISRDGKKLRDTILGGYRSKLLMKAKLREQLMVGVGYEGKILDMPKSSPAVLMHEPSIRRQFNAGKKGVPSPSTSQSINAAQIPVISSPAEKDTDDKEEERVENTSGSNNGPAQVSVANTQENPVAPPPMPLDTASVRTCRKSTSVVPARRVATGSPPSRMIARYNENSCTMTISSERCGSASPTLDPSIVVKQEPGSPSPVPVRYGKRKRRSLFQGIEILKISDPATNKVYLQCSICKYPVLLSNPLNSDVSPHQIMTQHITDKHLGKRRRAALQMAASTRETAKTRRTQFTCKICFLIFEDMKTLLHHKATHTAEELTARENANAGLGMPPKSYYIPNLQCNICGRPVKGNLSNLEVHKFSHKNNEEREEALKKNERGARNSRIRPLGPKACTPGVVQEKLKKVRRVKKSRKGKAFPVATANSSKKITALILKEKPSSVNGSIHCKHCSRTFTRNCHYVLHMQMHYRRNKVVAVTQAAEPGPPSPSVVEPQVNGTQLVEENPQTCEEQPNSSTDEVSAEFSNEEIVNILREDNPNGDEMQV